MDLIYIDFETELIYHKELRVIDIMGKIVFFRTSKRKRNNN